MRLHEARCTLLASVMKIDGVICIEEIEAGLHISEEEVIRDRRCKTSDWSDAMITKDRSDEAIAKLLLHSVNDRKAVIDLLWRMAGADKNVHTEEIKLIGEYARKLGISNYCFSDEALRHARDQLT